MQAVDLSAVNRPECRAFHQVMNAGEWRGSNVGNTLIPVRGRFFVVVQLVLGLATPYPSGLCVYPLLEMRVLYRPML